MNYAPRFTKYFANVLLQNHNDLTIRLTPFFFPLVIKCYWMSAIWLVKLQSIHFFTFIPISLLKGDLLWIEYRTKGDNRLLARQTMPLCVRKIIIAIAGSNYESSAGTSNDSRNSEKIQHSVLGTVGIFIIRANFYKIIFFTTSVML